MSVCIPCQQASFAAAQPATAIPNNPVIGAALAQLAAMGITADHPVVAQELQKVLSYAVQVAQPIELPPWDACVSISVSIPSRCFRVGEEVPITLTARSGGPSDVCRNNVARSAFLELVWIDLAKVEVVDAAGGQFQTPLGIPRIQWQLGDLSPGQSVSRTVRLRVKQPVPCIGFDACAFALNAPATCFPAIFCVSTAAAPAPGGGNMLPLLIIGGAVLGLGALWWLSQQEQV
jgi:hypothetical protein